MRTIVVSIIFSIGIFMTGCQVVPSTGDKSTDAAAAQNFVPQSIPGYIATDATSITDALSKAGAAASLLSGNILSTGAIVQLDRMIECYKGVGAVAARVYTEQNPTTTTIPKIGALAVVNTTRLQTNFLSCALNVGGASAQSAGEIQPCGGSGEKVVNNERLQYVYGATTPELCTIFQSKFN
jgi:phage tail sheath protein FI